SFEQQVGHHRMISDRLTICPDLAARTFCEAVVQLKLTRDYRLGEITFADKIRDDVHFANRFGIEQEQCVAQTWFLFPKGALHVGKNLSAPNLRSMRQRRRARIRIYRRPMTDDEKRGAGVVGIHSALT